MQSNLSELGEIEAQRNAEKDEKTFAHMKHSHIRITLCLLDLSSPASSQSVMILSSTGLGGLEKRLTKAMMVGNTSVTRWLKVWMY